MSSDATTDLPSLDGPTLRAWRSDRPAVAPEMLWKAPADAQIAFVARVAVRAWARSYEEYYAAVGAGGGEGVRVVGMHRSKSIDLPVYGLDLAASHGLRVVARCNFHNWMVSVAARAPLPAAFGRDARRLFNPATAHAAVYCEGFPAGWVFGAFAADRARFTLECDASEHEFFTLLFLLDRAARGEVAP